MNIDENKSEFSYTEDYDKWCSIVESIRPKFLKDYDLKFLTAPTSSYYDKFLIAKSRMHSLAKFKKILKDNPSDVVLYSIYKFEYTEPLTYNKNYSYIFRYALISLAV